MVRSKRQKVICYIDRQLQQSKVCLQVLEPTRERAAIDCASKCRCAEGKVCLQALEPTRERAAHLFCGEEVHRICRRSRSPGCKVTPAFFGGSSRSPNHYSLRPPPKKTSVLIFLRLRSVPVAAPQNWPLCFATSGNLAMMAANIAPLFQHGESVVLSGRSGRTACVPRSQTLLVAERCALR